MSVSCDICGQEVKNQIGLSVHRTKVHPDHEDLETCIFCGHRYGGTGDRWLCPCCQRTNRPSIRGAVEAGRLFYASGRGSTFHLLPPNPSVSLCGQVTVPTNTKGTVNRNMATPFRGFENHDKPEEYWCSNCERIYQVLVAEGTFPDLGEVEHR